MDGFTAFPLGTFPVVCPRCKGTSPELLNNVLLAAHGLGPQLLAEFFD